MILKIHAAPETTVSKIHSLLALDHMHEREMGRKKEREMKKERE